jgi:hypothetical protein
LIFVCLGLFLAGTVFVLILLFGASTGDDVPRDDINEEEVSVTEIPRESIEEEHEVRDVPWRPVLYGAFTLLAVAIVIHVAFWWLLERWTGDKLRFDPQVPPAIVAGRESAAPEVERPNLPGPDLQSAPALEYELYRSRQLEILESYGQSDTEAGFARIPIRRAMELLVEEGLPARDGEVPSFGLEPAYELESTGGQVFDPGFGEESSGQQ